MALLWRLNWKKGVTSMNRMCLVEGECVSNWEFGLQILKGEKKKGLENLWTVCVNFLSEKFVGTLRKLLWT